MKKRTRLKRLEVIWDQLPLEVMSSLLLEGKGFLAEIERLRDNKKRDLALTGKLVRKRRRVKNSLVAFWALTFPCGLGDKRTFQRADLFRS
jgi:hypothetical protein